MIPSRDHEKEVHLEEWQRLPKPAVADIDGDGLNEVVLVTSEPKIKIFKTGGETVDETPYASVRAEYAPSCYICLLNPLRTSGLFAFFCAGEKRASAGSNGHRLPQSTQIRLRQETGDHSMSLVFVAHYSY